MALQDDDTICFCFHVPLRKVVNFCRIEKPQVPSQISQCLSAGTGCGWCIPMLRKVHAKVCGPGKRPWDQQTAPDQYHSPERDAAEDQIDPAAYAAGRQQYLKQTGNKPPQA